MKTCIAVSSFLQRSDSEVSKFPSWPAVKNSGRNLSLPGNEVSSFGSTWFASKIATDKAFFAYRKNRTIKRNPLMVSASLIEYLWKRHSLSYISSCLAISGSRNRTHWNGRVQSSVDHGIIMATSWYFLGLSKFYFVVFSRLIAANYSCYEYF